MKKILLILVILNSGLVIFPLSAQEQLFPLSINNVLATQQNSSSGIMRLSAINDTLILPFIDDFSRPGNYPYEGLWLDSNVYINNNYTKRPVTIGIATFDGLNQNGQPYHPSSTVDSIADVLTSRPINLIVPSGDTSVWISFFYQPQGLGDVPETGDSLILQFKDTSNTWTTIWSVKGQADTAFQRVNIRITNPVYLFNGFQFRFYNIATVNGNRDHWNLDYVTLLKNTIANAPILDNALIRPQSSLLTEYSAMPYPHYKSLSSQLAAMKTSIEDTIYNIDYGQTSYTTAADISQNGTTLFSGSNFASTLTSQVYIPFSIPMNSFAFPVQNQDTADFLVRSYFSQNGVETNSFNDTSYYTQHFHNYYAYDDGSAEVAYGLTGSQDVSLAVRFDVKMLDTLRGVQIYFNPTGVNITNKLFQLTAWSNIDIATNQSTELFREINQKPDSFDGINAFKTFLFTNTIVVNPGPVWVGFIQNEPQTLYGVGFDRNTDSHDKVAVRLAGSWLPSGVYGSLMIRPLFGKRISGVSVEETAALRPEFSVSPNPANGKFHLAFNNPAQKKFHLQLFDCLGSIISEEKITGSGDFDISGFSAGIYMVRLSDETAKTFSVRKLVIN